MLQNGKIVCFVIGFIRFNKRRSVLSSSVTAAVTDAVGAATSIQLQPIDFSAGLSAIDDNALLGSALDVNQEVDT